MSDTTSKQAQLAAGLEHYQAGRLDDAIAVWKEGLEAVPGQALLHHNLGIALSDKEDWDRAVGHWREAIRLRPDFYAPHHALVDELARRPSPGKGRAFWHEARSLCRQALALNPADPAERAYYLRLLGQSEWRLGDRRAALEALEEAVQIGPDNVRGHEWLGFVQQRSGQWRSALRTICTMVNLPNYEDSPQGRRNYRRGLLGLAVLLTGGVLLAWRLTRRR